MNFRGLYVACLALGCANSSSIGDDAGNDVRSLPDAPELDSSTVDAAFDAGSDAELDSGLDSGLDAGSDSGTLPTGDCDGPADCESGECVELTPGGWRVCTDPRVEVDTCSSSIVDACGCEGTPSCEGGVACVRSPLTPTCSGAELQLYNVCAVDECSSHADCGEDSICSPERVLGRQVRTCMRVPCRTNADCSDSPGGICAPISEPCCGVAFLGRVYAGGCRDGGDCGGGQSCMGGVCSDGDILCPPMNSPRGRRRGPRSRREVPGHRRAKAAHRSICRALEYP